MTWEESESAPLEELYPMVLNPLNTSGLFLKVSLDKKTVKYVGSAPYSNNEVGAVQADAPAPTQRITYYFEMTIKNSGEHGRTAIGFTCKDYNLLRQPGWDANSCGYHGDNGHIYCGHGIGEPFGPTFTSGDIVGAGINYASDEFFFTKNGKLVGTLCKNITGPLYPTVSVHSWNEEVSVNFGEKQFLFDIKVNEGLLCRAQFDLHQNDGADLERMSIQVEFGEEMQQESSSTNEEGAHVTSQDCSMEKVGESLQVDNPASEVEENLVTTVSEYQELAIGKAGELIFHSSVGKIDLRNLQEMDNKDLLELKELGSGGFGTVYHGKWRGVDVAIKRIKKSSIVGQQSGQDKLILESLREAGILSKVQHPNVVSLYGFTLDELSSTLAIVMELVGGGSLRNFLHHKKYLDHCNKLTLAKDAAFGMEYLHLKNIVHFDLKSDNLLVDLKDPSRPTCKVTDFGLSKIKENTLVSGSFRGTLPWMAPELLKRGNNKVSEKVDVYSFGIVMWELITGEVPYSGMDVGEIIGGIYDNTLRPPVPASCDPEWRELMEQCWAVNPQERPSFEEVARRLHLMLLVGHAEASK